MSIEEIINYLHSINNVKTKDIDLFNKKLIKAGEDVSGLKDLILDDQLLHRTYFQVSLGKIKSFEEQLLFIEQNAYLLKDWWHVDQLTQFMRKPLDFEYVYNLSKNYVLSDNTFLRRWGYVVFLCGLQKEEENVDKIICLLKDDNEYYVQMSEAWLIADVAVYQFEKVYKFLEKSKMSYVILGKAIQKICDSFRISKENKERCKQLRSFLKNN